MERINAGGALALDPPSAPEYPSFGEHLKNLQAGASAVVEKIASKITGAAERVAKVFDRNEREFRKLDPTLAAVRQHETALSAEFAELDDDAIAERLQAQTADFRERLDKGESLDDILPEAYAAASLAIRHQMPMIEEIHDAQLQGAIALHQGRISEMQTGEGKTITAVFPAYLNALTKNGVHVITANEYLAGRDAENMGKIFGLLGLSTGLVTQKSTREERKAAYAADITYGTSSQFGFDYLRDNLALTPDAQVQRGHAFAIVDEVDSILLDDARTPMIIAGQPERPSPFVKVADRFISTLGEPAIIDADTDTDDPDYEEPDAYYVVNLKTGTATLTEAGLAKAERFFGMRNSADPEHAEKRHYIEQALRARGVMKKGVDYIVTEQDGQKQIVIIDKNTGRPQPGRHFNNGLHEAIEVKEGIRPTGESRTTATISVQNYYRQYSKLSGMTGTAATDRQEFADAYGLDVLEIPPAKGRTRQDQPDRIFPTEAAKNEAIIEQVKTCIAAGRPILIGTTSVNKSRELSDLLDAAGIPHQTLNAENEAKESAIIAQAGRAGAVTIATNMAGRGTDIKLGGEPSADETPDQRQAREAEAAAINAAGGLFVLGAERNQNRRVDGQLRGRAGRQGDKGESQFFVSLTDHLLSVFGGDSADRAQRLAEDTYRSSRRRAIQYDNALSEPRRVIFEQRQQVLLGVDVDGQPLDMTPEERENLLRSVDRHWMDYLATMDDIRRGISLVAYAERDPVEEYRRRAHEVYDEMIADIKREMNRQ